MLNHHQYINDAKPSCDLKIRVLNPPDKIIINCISETYMLIRIGLLEGHVDSHYMCTEAITVRSRSKIEKFFFWFLKNEIRNLESVPGGGLHSSIRFYLRFLRLVKCNSGKIRAR